MCGVCGEFRFDGNVVEPRTLQRMLGPLRYRGPDNEGVFQSKAIGLGHRRL
jgi:asparagine synthase (glutamine-hydrolysing)